MFWHNRGVTTRPVYSTSQGRLCADCGQPVAGCTCAQRPDQPVPAAVRATLRLEVKGRGGKRVTVVAGLPDNQAFLQELAAALKTACGTGGTVRPGAIELAGDVRPRLRTLLPDRGITVRG